ncbi:MAG: class I SAM-dependent methyltransferase [Nanoarchaeota archaeon]|nr:class I SAM-dependent methyltransferase [Nanoarchaeota archaeon]
MKMYNEMAKYVDLTYSTKDYAKEVKFITDIFRKYQAKPKLIYDVACGSGNHSKLLIAKGYRVIGVDSNKGMLKLARQNVPKMPVFQQDMRTLNIKEKADCIITMFNAINHLTSYTDFERMLRAYKNNLNEGGLIIFDTMFDQRNWHKEFWNSKTIKKGNLIIGKVDRSYRQSKNRGFVHQVYVIFEGKQKKCKIMESKYNNFIYELPKMNKIIMKLGFKHNIYYNFSITAKRTSGCFYLFVLQKA